VEYQIDEDLEQLFSLRNQDLQMFSRLFETQILSEVDKYEIMPEFLDLALDFLNKNEQGLC
jgi:hypothetical protein